MNPEAVAAAPDGKGNQGANGGALQHRAVHSEARAVTGAPCLSRRRIPEDATGPMGAGAPQGRPAARSRTGHDHVQEAVGKSEGDRPSRLSQRGVVRQGNLHPAVRCPARCDRTVGRARVGFGTAAVCRGVRRAAGVAAASRCRTNPAGREHRQDRGRRAPRQRVPTPHSASPLTTAMASRSKPPEVPS